VVIGDDIAVTRRDGKTFHYRVTATSVVRFDASDIDPLAEGYQLALSTCWPLDAITPGPMRYVVRATLVANGTSTAS
jgi:sortase A